MLGLRRLERYCFRAISAALTKASGWAYSTLFWRTLRPPGSKCLRGATQLRMTSSPHFFFGGHGRGNGGWLHTFKENSQPLLIRQYCLVCCSRLRRRVRVLLAEGMSIIPHREHYALPPSFSASSTCCALLSSAVYCHTRPARFSLTVSVFFFRLLLLFLPFSSVQGGPYHNHAGPLHHSHRSLSRGTHTPSRFSFLVLWSPSFCFAFRLMLLLAETGESNCKALTSTHAVSPSPVRLLRSGSGSGSGSLVS